MQFTKAQELQKLWGNAPCDHPQWDKEYYLSSDTGDYVCTTCGKTVSKETKEKLEDYNNKDKEN